MRAHIFAVAVLSIALTTTSAHSTVLIKGDHGGLMEDYVARFQPVRESGEPVVIDGECYSACTMLLGLVPRKQICATPKAILGFHAAWQFNKSGDRVPSVLGTRDLMKTYPASVRAWIARHGGLSPNMMFVRGHNLAAIVELCDKTTRGASLRRERNINDTAQRRGLDLQRARADAR